MAPDSEPTPRVPWLPVHEGAEPTAPESEDDLAAFSPIVPAWITREEPGPAPAAEVEEPTPAPPPPAEEVLPEPGTAPAELEDPPQPALHPDAVQLLGESAVASATLSAAGAPTPLGGVPLSPADTSVTPPDFGDAPSFVPEFEEEAPDPPTPHNVRADALAAGIVAHEQERLASQASELDAGAAYTPRAFGEPTAELASNREGAPAATPAAAAPAAAAPATAAPAPQGEPATQAEPASGRRSGRLWLWILLAVVALAILGVVYAVMNKPEPTVVPGVTITQPAPSPTIVPSPAPTGSDFQAAMPTTVGTYSLTSAAELEPADVALTVGRIADGVDLTYRSGDDTMTVRALQYYSEDDAKAMFTQFAGEDTATEPVEAGGTTVGEKAIVTAPKPGLVWRNGTSVFILVGPPLQLAEFYAQFGL